MEESDSTGIISRPVHHGEGDIDMRGFFDTISSFPSSSTSGRWPGVSEGAHIHEGENSLEELYYFLDGRGEMWFGEETLQVEAGDAVLVPQDVDHGMRNNSDKPMRVIVVWGKPDRQAADVLSMGRGKD